MKDPFFRSYKGLASFADPSSFDAAIQDAVYRIEAYFGCFLEPIESSRNAYEHFLILIALFNQRHINHWLILNVIAHTVRLHMKFAFVAPSDEKHEARYLKLIADYPSDVVGVVIAIAAMRAEFEIPMVDCQISLEQIAQVVDRLGRDKTLLLFDQTDILRKCATYV